MVEMIWGLCMKCKEYYEGNICKKCNIYQECCDDSLKDRISKTAIHNNFVISNTTLEIQGHCLDCSQK